jgi:hypothetical protein
LKLWALVTLVQEDAPETRRRAAWTWQWRDKTEFLIL